MLNVGGPNEVLVRDVAPPFAEPAGLAYFDAPIAVKASAAEDGVQYEARIGHPPLDAKGLLALLGEVAPAGRQPRASVVMDWRIADEPMSNQRLMKLHAQLGQPWQQFMQSRPAFLRVLADGSYNLVAAFGLKTLEDSNLPHAFTVGFEAALALAAHQRAATWRILDTMLREPSLAAGVDPRSLLQAAINRRRLKPFRSVGDAMRHFLTLPPGKFSFLLKGIVGQAKDRQESFIEGAKTHLYQSASGGQGVRFFVPRHAIHGSLEQAVAEARTVRFGSMAGKVATVSWVAWNGQRTPVEFVVPGSVHAVDPDATIAPRLIWTKRADGSRSFGIGDGPTTTDAQGLQYQDGVLGVLLAAYLAKGSRGDWKDKMGLRGARDPQQIRAAQVPVFALFPGRQSDVLASPFIANAEKIATAS